jgi:hypothetical protein
MSRFKWKISAMLIEDEKRYRSVMRELGSMIKHTSPERRIRVEKGGHKFGSTDVKLNIQLWETYATLM